MYFENVGAISDEVFKYLNRFARVPVCGAISAYNNERRYWTTYQGTLIKNQALMQGFVVAQFADHFKKQANNSHNGCLKVKLNLK